MNEKAVILNFSNNVKNPMKNPTASSEKRRVESMVKVEFAELGDGIAIVAHGVGKGTAKKAIIKAIKDAVGADGGEVIEEWL